MFDTRRRLVDDELQSAVSSRYCVQRLPTDEHSSVTLESPGKPAVEPVSASAIGQFTTRLEFKNTIQID